MAKMNRKSFLLMVVAVATVLSGGGYLLYQLIDRPPRAVHMTYFSYTSAEVDSLRDLSSDLKMSIDDVFEWEDTLFDLVSDQRITRSAAKNMLAYLVVAQRDAAYLSHKVHHEFRGSIDPISREVACIFLSHVCQEIPVETDAYSERLTAIVLPKIVAKIRAAESNTKAYEMRSEDQYWDYGNPKVVSQETWLIDPLKSYRTQPPPEFGSDADLAQVQMVKDALDNITDDQILAVLRWSGGPYTVGTNALWPELATKYMRRTGFSDLAQALKIRSVLLMTVIDTRIVVDDSKYTYLVKRPATRLGPDDPLYTIMPTDDSPSYPSTSMVVAAAAATIMSYYFPENTDGWNDVAKQIGDSRVWSGIHYPMDPEQGATLGRQVGLDSLRIAEPLDSIDYEPIYEDYAFQPGTAGLG